MKCNSTTPTTFRLLWDSNPSSQTKNSFHQLSKEKALQIQDLMGFKPISKCFPASEITEKACEILKARANGI